MTTLNIFLLKADLLKVLAKMKLLVNQSEWKVMENYKLSDMPKLKIKMNLLKVMVKMKPLVNQSEWKVMENYNLSNMPKLKIKMNLLKVMGIKKN